MNPNPALTASSSSGGRPRRQRRNTDQSLAAEMVVGDEDLLTEVLKCLPASRFSASARFHTDGIDSITIHKCCNHGIAQLPPPPFSSKGSQILQKSNSTAFLSQRSTAAVGPSRDPTLFNSKHWILYQIEKVSYYKVIIGMNLVFVQPDKYLVVAMCSDRPGLPGYCHIETYDPETRAWKATSVSFIVNCPNCLCVYHGVLLDGVIYWIGRKTCNIWFYVVKEERLMGLTLPQPSYEERLSYFGEYGGQLCLIRLRESTSQNLNSLSHVPEFDVLVLEKDLSMWSVKYHIDPRISSFFPFEMRLGNDDYLFTVVSIVPGIRQGDSFLILYIPGEVVYFNLRDRTIEKIFNLKLRPCDVSALQMHPWSIVHQRVETSLGP